MDELNELSSLKYYNSSIVYYIHSFNDNSIHELEDILQQRNPEHYDYLAIYLPNNITDESMESIKQTAGIVHKLNLGLNGTNINDDGMRILCEAINGHPSLSLLSFSSCSISNQSCENLKKTLDHNPRIECIDFSRCQIQDQDLKLILEAIECHPSLIHINFNSCLLTSLGCQILTKSLNLNPRIQYLNFYGCQLKDEDVQILCEVIENHPSILHLNFEFSSFSTTGCYYLKKTLKGNKKLKHLDFSYCTIEENDLKLLFESIQKNYTFQSLVLDMSFTSEELSLIHEILKNPRVSSLNFKQTQSFIYTKDELLTFLTCLAKTPHLSISDIDIQYNHFNNVVKF